MTGEAAAIYAQLDQIQRDLDAVKAGFRTRQDLDRLRAQSCEGKKRYVTPEKAGLGAEAARINGSKDELRIYSCAFCGCYHLTKMPLALLAGVAP